MACEVGGTIRRVHGVPNRGAQARGTRGSLSQERPLPGRHVSDSRLLVAPAADTVAGPSRRSLKFLDVRVSRSQRARIRSSGEPRQCMTSGRS